MIGTACYESFLDGRITICYGILSLCHGFRSAVHRVTSDRTDETSFCKGNDFELCIFCYKYHFLYVIRYFEKYVWHLICLVLSVLNRVFSPFSAFLCFFPLRG